MFEYVQVQMVFIRTVFLVWLPIFRWNTPMLLYSAPLVLS